MKKLILLQVIMLFGILSSQQNIIYDFKSGEFEKYPINPKYGEPIVFKMKNINRFFYNPIVKGVSEDILDSNMYDVKIVPESDGTSDKSPEITEDSSIKNSNKPVKRIVFKEVKRPNLNIEDARMAAFSDSNKLIDDAKTEEQLYKNYKSNLKKISALFDIYVYQINKVNQNYNNYLDKINTPNLTYDDYKKLYDDSQTNDPLKKNAFEYSSILNNDKKNEFYVLQNLYFQQKLEFLNFLNSYEVYQLIQILNESNNRDVVAQINDEIGLLKTYINKTDAEIVKMQLHKKLNFVEIMNRLLLDPNTYEYTSDPVQGFGDYLAFDVEVKEKKVVDENFSIYIINRKFSYKEFVKGGLRLDFGVGVSFDFGKKDQSYDLTEENNKKYLLQTNKSSYTPKLVGLLHASRRSSTNLAYGISLGTSLDVANFDINSIYLGPSLLIGRTDKIIITAGPSFRSVKQLKSTLEKYTTEELPANFTLDEGAYNKNFKVGFFFAITYNLTNKQRGKFLQVNSNP